MGRRRKNRDVTDLVKEKDAKRRSFFFLGWISDRIYLFRPLVSRRHKIKPASPAADERRLSVLRHDKLIQTRGSLLQEVSSVLFPPGPGRHARAPAAQSLKPVASSSYAEPILYVDSIYTHSRRHGQSRYHLMATICAGDTYGLSVVGSMPVERTISSLCSCTRLLHRQHHAAHKSPAALPAMPYFSRMRPRVNMPGMALKPEGIRRAKIRH